MKDDFLNKLEQQMNRRSFLRGSALTAAAVAALPLAARAQDQQQGADTRDKEKDKDKDQKEEAEDKAEKKTEKKAEKNDGDGEKDPFKEIKLDAQGREYRMCPQCGYNMYKQDRTWTCENCGYSYVE
jgi:ribosomal protein S27AE